MNDSIKFVADIWAISLCFWGIVALLIIFQLKSFIIKRYEKETDLLNTVAFKEHAVMTRHLPGLLSTPLYTAHLLMCVWGWRLYGKRKAFRDIKNPQVVTRHFTKEEIRWAKWNAITLGILVVHGIAYYIFHLIWPRVFW